MAEIHNDRQDKEHPPQKPVELPVLPLRDVVVFPRMVIPLFVGRKQSVRALEAAVEAEPDRQILLVAQKDASIDEPKEDDLYQVGTIATVLQLLKLPDATVKVLVEGQSRAKINYYELAKENEHFLAGVEILSEEETDERSAEVLTRSLLATFEQYTKLNKKLPTEILSTLGNISDPGQLADAIAAHLTLKLNDKQSLLESIDPQSRVEKLMALLESEMQLLQVEHRIRGRVKQQMEKTQREYYLNEQLKAIQKEMGELTGERQISNELDELAEKIKRAGMPKDVEEKAQSELNKLRAMPLMSAEATVSRNYLDTLLSVPWKKRSKINNDLKKAERILNAEHYGLEKVKERIIEYLAVQMRVKKLKGPILCLVGPPGVGKTSLGRSIAKAIGREYVRMSLGGVRDEAEIRGHRRTYIGALPGKIMQSMIKVGVRNPLFLLDEVDKMAMDFRGDPASALLEVLDPEQNSAFNDHYLEVDYDLSEVLFITTANTLNIPEPLLDRMEVIRLSGYTEDEKINIALRHIIPKQILQHGLKPEEIKITESAVRDIIRYYTREAGVRNLEREIAKICRKVVREIITKSKRSCTVISRRNLEKYLGVQRFRFGVADRENRIGEVNGLAWTAVGGELLNIEAVAVPGKGKTVYTGKLGDVMQESIQTALTVVRSRAASLGIDKEYFEKNDIHVHVPEGAIPKDGPSAGISMCTALVSVITGIPVRADVAMTGEITLRGEVLPIGGLKEKLLAAKRANIRLVIIPEENKRELKEIPKNILQGLEIHCVRWIDQVLNLALQESPLKKQ